MLMPKAGLTPLATYGGRWTEFCRQPLVWLGLDDPAEGLIEQLKTDPESASLGLRRDNQDEKARDNQDERVLSGWR